MFEIGFINPSHEDLPNIIKDAIGYPTDEKVLKVINSYNSSDCKIIGVIHEKLLIGIIGIKLIDNSVNIQHIAVSKKYRSQGVGTMLIEYIKHLYGEKILFAETDEDALNFYIKNRFVCKALKNVYGYYRYICELKN